MDANQRKKMEPRKSGSFQFGRSPTFKSCFPETRSTEGSDYRPSLHARAHSYDVLDGFNAVTSMKDISYENDTSTSSVQLSSGLVLYNNALYNNLSQNVPLADFQNIQVQPIVAAQNAVVVPGESVDRVTVISDQRLQPTDPPPVEANTSVGQHLKASYRFASFSSEKGASSMDAIKGCQTRHVPLYLAALKGDWKTAKLYLRWNPHAVRAMITRGLETALHIAAGAGHTHVVKKLVKRMTPDDLALQNKAGNTALCFAAASGITEIAMVLVNKNKHLPLLRGSQGATPLYMAVLLGKRDMVWYLYSVTNNKDLSGEDRMGLLVAAITSNLFDLSLELIQSHPELTIARDGNGETALHVLSRKPSSFYSGSQLGLWHRCIYSCLQVKSQPDFLTRNDGRIGQLITGVLSTAKLLLWNSLVYIVPDIKLMYHLKLRHIQALALVKQIWQQILYLDDADIRDMIRKPRQLLFTAAEFGIVEFITVLIGSYPDLIWKVDEHSRSIFHIAVMHRQEKVFNLIHGLGALKDFIAIYRDESNNNMLHLAGILPPQNRLKTESGAALQLRRELLWFKEVEKTVQPLYAEMQNSNGETPQFRFSKEHKKLLRDGEKWLKDTASSCMVVSTLIATMMFAAAFTVPGGNNDETGIPIYRKTRYFVVFVVSDALALLSAAISILIFLSILTSRYAEEDFLHSLPKKLIMGLVTLFFSITAMMIAFSATLFIILGPELEWVSIPISVLAGIPATLFAFLHFPLLSDMVTRTYSTSMFYSSRRHLLS